MGHASSRRRRLSKTLEGKRMIMTNRDKIKQIGFIHILIAATLSLFFVTIEINGPILQIFILIVTLFLMATGLGAIFQTKWGYHLLKFSSNLLSIGFPIGTIYGLKLYRFLQQDNVKELFKIHTAKSV